MNTQSHTYRLELSIKPQALLKIKQSNAAFVMSRHNTIRQVLLKSITF